MAITAAVALADTTLQSGQTAYATLTVSNSGAADVVVTNIKPTISPATASAAVGACPFGGPQPSTVAASGSTKFYFPLVGFAPQVANLPQTPATYAIVVGALVYTNDGALTVATTDTLTVSPSITVI